MSEQTEAKGKKKDHVREPQGLVEFAVTGTYHADKAETTITVSGSDAAGNPRPAAVGNRPRQAD